MEESSDGGAPHPSPNAPEGDGWTWAIVEIMGFRKHAGRIREVEQYGAKMLRVDEPFCAWSLEDPKVLKVERWETHLYGGSAIFGITPTTEDVVMKANRPPEPYHRYLPRPDPEPDPDDELNDNAGEGEV